MADDDLAYGEYHGQGGETGERGFLGDAFRRFTGGGRPGTDQQPNTSNITQTYQPHLSGQPQNIPGPPPANPQSSTSGMSLFDRLHSGVHKLGTELKTRIATGEIHSHTHEGGECHPGAHDPHRDNRYFSFAPQRPAGNDVKWYVDACGYMWAVSKALETARESIWILDWWLSPELYLRRPPAKNEQYRIDNMLKAAAARGVKVNIIVYKEVTQALTRKYLSPSVPDYLHSLLPASTDAVTKGLTKLGLLAIFKSLEQLEIDAPLIEPPISVSSSHTKHHLEDLHPNICVFRHPDHLPDKQNMAQDFVQGLQSLKLSAASLAQMPGNALGALYGSTDGTVLYWAHHEKLCLVDGTIAFMGGLDLCYGRWDTNQHSISDAHPGDVKRIVFPGQDYNNSRIMDFQDVVHWENNKLDRTQNSRMGWTDISICISGPAVQDLREHFVQRWNMIYEEKYRVRKDTRYSLLSVTPVQSSAPLGQPAPPAQQTPSYQQNLTPQPIPGYQPAPGSGQSPIPQQTPGYQQGVPQFEPPPGQATRGFDGDGEGERGFLDEDGERGLLGGREGGLRSKMKQRVEQEYKHFEGSKYGQQLQEYAGRYGLHHNQRPTTPGGSYIGMGSGCSVQVARSCAKWSHGGPIEHSIANAYIDVIRNSEHFIYIENQFFITATTDRQKPIKNKIGAAIVERVLRAARNGQHWKMIVIMPAVPAFAGDLRNDDALATRAIMEFQYNSINRGGDSIYETIARAGFNPLEYIRFYNLRNYDRINSSAAMAQAEQASGVKYEDARKQFDATYGGGFANEGATQSRGVDDVQSRDPYPGQPQYGAGQPQFGQPPSQASYQAYHPPGSEPVPPPQQSPAELAAAGYQPPPPPAPPAAVPPQPAAIPPQTAAVPPQPAAVPPPEQQQGGYGEQPQYQGQNPLGQYQQAAQNIGGPLASGRWDSVAECYMLNGEDIRNVPWEGSPEAEINAFVTEELYVHSKLLIADDRIVICGSANLNDRSQLGDHDSEIAVIIEDHTLMDSTMDGRPWKATRFAATLRRQIFKKHLGLLATEDYEKEDANCFPVGVPNDYKYGTEEDRVVADPLDPSFQNLWNSRARTNTDVFGKVFHPVPHDSVVSWKDYDEWYSKHFREADPKDKTKPVGKYKVGHVVTEEFPGGVQQVKEELSKIRGTLVEMPLLFLKSEDIAQEGLGLNAFTEEVYT